MVNCNIKMEAVKSKQNINSKTKTVNSNIKLKMVKGKSTYCKRRLEMVNSKTKMANIELKVVRGKT